LKTVLVVDDDASIVDVLATLLDEEGFAVVRAYDGEQAWGLVQRSPPDLVITDVSMPNLGGLDLIRRMRSVEPCRRTPVILMSAAYRRSAPEGAAFVPKPFDLERMLSLVERELAIA
jgi:CheY-like chemotaxis protein